MNTATQLQPPTFDLSRVRQLVSRENSDWPSERLDVAQAEYLRFLQLCKAHPDRKIAAPEDIDQFWHAHMLDSMAYVRDCDAYFGHYLHHDPCIGTSTMENTEQTLMVYEDTFHAPPPAVWMGLMTCAGAGKGCGSIQAASHM